MRVVVQAGVEQSSRGGSSRGTLKALRHSVALEAYGDADDQQGNPQRRERPRANLKHRQPKTQQPADNHAPEGNLRELVYLLTALRLDLAQNRLQFAQAVTGLVCMGLLLEQLRDAGRGAFRLFRFEHRAPFETHRRGDEVRGEHLDGVVVIGHGGVVGAP
jgi:hypothetical protein